MSRLNLELGHRYPGGFQMDLAFASDRPVTALFGPSGSGKTSILRAIAGFLRPSRGRIELAGETLLDTGAGFYLPPERRRLGMVFQDHLLFPHLSVEANLRYGRRRRGRAHRPVDLARVVEVLQIGPLLKRYPRNLSGGEKQRVALGRALLCSPRLLLMDEPLASLDADLKAKVLAYLEQAVAEWRIPVLYVTHSQAEVRRLAGWVVVVENGRVVASGTPEDAFSRPETLGWKNSVGPVNLLRLEEVKKTGDRAAGLVGGQRVQLPPERLPRQSPVFVQFSPIDVTLSRGDVPGLSARNHLRGHVRQLVPLNSAVFVAVDVGQLIWAEVTPEAVADLALQPGSEVTCLLKVHSLEVVS